MSEVIVKVELELERAPPFEVDIEVDSSKVDDGTVIRGADAVAEAGAKAASKADEHMANAADGASMPAARQGDNGKKTEDISDNVSDPANTDFERGAVVWVRIKGHPWWPGIVLMIADVPRSNRKVIADHTFEASSTYNFRISYTVPVLRFDSTQPPVRVRNSSSVRTGPAELP